MGWQGRDEASLALSKAQANKHRVVPISRAWDSDEEPAYRCAGCGAIHRYPDEFDPPCPAAQLGLDA